MPELAIIGGSGLYNMESLEVISEEVVDTPYGNPSDNIVIGKMLGKEVAFLSRHGRGHVLNPSEINYRANIYALKKIGVSRILSVSAVGSMREEISPGDLVVVNQFFDRTFKRENTFFNSGIVAHVSMADPVCPELSALLRECVTEVVGNYKTGTYICIEGPQFSSRAESNIYRQWNVDVIGMTNATEAKLAREAEICYCTLALVTDYDCWHVSEDNVTVEEILKTMNENIDKAKKVAGLFVKKLDSLKGECECQNALKNSIVTDPEKINESIRDKLSAIIKKYV